MPTYAEITSKIYTNSTKMIPKSALKAFLEVRRPQEQSNELCLMLLECLLAPLGGLWAQFWSSADPAGMHKSDFFAEDRHEI